MKLMTFILEHFDIDGSRIKTETVAYCSDLRLNEALTQLDQQLHASPVKTKHSLISVADVDFITHANRKIFGVRRIENGVI